MRLGGIIILILILTYIFADVIAVKPYDVQVPADNNAVFPTLALVITMFAFNFLGDGLRDALDPRMRGTQ